MSALLGDCPLKIGTYCLLLFSKRTFFVVAVYYYLQQRYNIIKPTLYIMKLKTESVFVPMRPAPNQASLMLPGDNLSVSTQPSLSTGAILQRPSQELNRPSEAHLLLWCSGTVEIQVNRESPPAQSRTVTCN